MGFAIVLIGCAIGTAWLCNCLAGETSADDLTASFLKLGINDPNKNDSNDAAKLAEVARRQQCAKIGKTWNEAKKCCGDNCSAPAPVADLSIDYFGINSTSAIKGKNYPLTVRIRNSGGPALPTMVVFSGSPELVKAYNLSGPRTIPALGQGQIYALTVNPANNALDVPIGTYNCRAVVNPNQTSFKETTLQNNEATTIFAVIAQPSTSGPPKQKVSGGTASPKN